MIKVALICPCPIEYKTCRNILELSNETELAGRAVASKTSEDIDLMAIEAGPGKTQCASATQLVIDNFQPDYVIDVGGAGALSNELNINDIVCAKNAFEHDVYDIDKFLKWPSGLTTSTALTRLLSSESGIIQEFTDWVALHGSSRLVVGDIASGENIVSGGELRRDLRDKLGAIACNWETSAVLRTAQLNSVQAFSFRVITDTADRNYKEQIKQNWEGALKILYTVLKEFIHSGWLDRISQVL